MSTADPRTEPPPRVDERSTLAAFLAYQRATLQTKCAGLDAEALARRVVPHSSLSLLGLVRHLADVERSWFRRVLSGLDAPPVFYTSDARDDDVDGATADPAIVEQEGDAWHEEVAFAERFVAGAPDLDVTGHEHWRGAMSLRWVLVHMIEEYARHNGHADLLRQGIDGAAGE